MATHRRWSFANLSVAAVTIAPLLIANPSAFLAHAFPKEDLIDQLPGYDGQLPSKWYSGYLEYTLPALDNRLVHTHYVYVEQASSEKEDPDVDLGDEGTSSSTTSRRVNGKNDDDESPLIYWSNGGPGASSLFGLLTELGPLMLNDNSIQTESYNTTGVPTLFENNYSWNKLGSLLIFEAPAPVGYSYCDDNASGDGLSCGGWDDESSAWNNYHALLAFYEKFPELKSKPLYLTGESYAGIYIPSLARKILENKQDAHTDEDDTIPEHPKVPKNSFPLKGFAVGDGCVGTEVNCGAEAPLFNLLFMAGHGQISIKMYAKVMETCTKDELVIPGYKTSQACADVLGEARKQIGGFYEYSLYDECTYRNGILSNKRGDNSNMHHHPLRGGTHTHKSVDASGGLNDYVCGGGPVMEEYVRHPAVKEAWHVLPEANFFDGDNGVGFNYTPTEPNLMSFYADVAKGKYSAEGLKVLVYNGDTDPSINSLVAQNWTSHLGLEEYEAWRPWTLDSCKAMGGYVTRYEGLFDFLTIRGAGHMVPTYKPVSSFVFLKSWINDEPYPYFDATCSHP